MDCFRILLSIQTCAATAWLGAVAGAPGGLRSAGPPPAGALAALDVPPGMTRVRGSSSSIALAATAEAGAAAAAALSDENYGDDDDLSYVFDTTAARAAGAYTRPHFCSTSAVEFH
jgi:hypothetical protein